MILASSAMMEISAESATARPAPAAAPLMAQMTGLSSSIMFHTMARASSPMAIIFSASPMLGNFLIQIAAGAKGTPGTRHYDYPGLGIHLYGFPDLGELGVHPSRRCVHLFRSVDGDEQDAVWLAFELQELIVRVFHCVSPVSVDESYRIAPALRTSAA